jgi:ferredoxin
MSRRLRVDPIACTGHGLCAEHFPEGIALDDWGYPILADAAVRDDALAHARRAVSACPALALALEQDGMSGGGRA